MNSRPRSGTDSKRATESSGELAAAHAHASERAIERPSGVRATAEGRPKQVAELVDALAGEDPVVRLRAADALEKVVRTHSAALGPHVAELLGPIADTKQAEVRWHIAQLIPRLVALGGSARRARRVLEDYLTDPSVIVRTEAMTSLVTLANDRPAMRARVRELVAEAASMGHAAERARARRLARAVERWTPKPGRRDDD